MLFESCFLSSRPIIANPLMYSATSNNMKLVHWPLMAGGGSFGTVRRGLDMLTFYGWAFTFGTARGDWAGPQPAQAPPYCTKCNRPPVNGQYTNLCITVRCCAVLMCP